MKMSRLIFRSWTSNIQATNKQTYKQKITEQELKKKSESTKQKNLQEERHPTHKKTVTSERNKSQSMDAYDIFQEVLQFESDWLLLLQHSKTTVNASQKLKELMTFLRFVETRRDVKKSPVFVFGQIWKIRGEINEQ